MALIHQFLASLRRDEEGQGLAEYALILALIAIVAVACGGGGATSAENDFGWNIGGGIKIPLSTSFETFIEARYNSVKLGGTNGGTASFIPVTVGILF